MIVYRKKTNELQVAVYARHTNVRKKMQETKMPCFEEIITLLGKGKYTKICDINNAFGSIPIAEE